MNPGAARPVSRVAVSAARKGAESDEETGVRRGHARPDRPRLHADGARIRQARGGGPPGARTLVPDGTRDVPGPEAAAVCAGASGELIPEPSSWRRIRPGTIGWHGNCRNQESAPQGPVLRVTRRESRSSTGPHRATVSVPACIPGLLRPGMCHVHARSRRKRPARAGGQSRPFSQIGPVHIAGNMSRVLAGMPVPGSALRAAAEPRTTN